MSYPLLINGELIATPETDTVINPANLTTVGFASRATSDLIAQAALAAQAAFPAWSANEPLRREAMLNAANTLAEHAQAVAELIAKEQGRPFAQCQGEVLGAVATLKHYANVPLPEAQALSSNVTIEYRAQGVVAAITPWNVPIILLILKIAPALLAGNTVLVKPSEFTPLATLYLGQIWQGIFPKGVLNILAGGADVGAQIAAQKAVRHISFTGSIATGQKLIAQSAQGVKRLTLELGGNDAAIVLADADIPAIAEKLFWGAFTNAGQICFAIKRLYVHHKKVTELTHALTEIANKVIVGDAFDPQSQIGPLTTQAQFARINELVNEAKAQGAVIHAGGEPLGVGYFYRPTLVSNLPHDSRLIVEEQFGPVLPIITFSDLNEAIELANSSDYGLGASVWGTDPVTLKAVAAQLEAGLVWVNQHGAIFPGAPKGGQKHSGLGYEGGAAGLHAFLQQTVVNVGGAQ